MIGAWDGLEEFVMVARAGSFTAGAKAFGASVTHMSRSVARLESRLQAQLFHRTTRSLRLTDTGRLFYESCSRIIDAREEAIAEITDQGEPHGHLNITCSHALGERYIGPLVREFAQQHPALEVSINLDNNVTDLIADGYDLAVRTGDLHDSRLIATRIASRPLLTVASPQYLAAHGTPTTVADLAAHACINGSSTKWRFANGQSFRPKGRWASNSGQSVLEAALAGMGVCQLPAFYVWPHLAQESLIEILVEHKAEAEAIWALYPQRRHLSPKVSGLVALFRSRLQSMLDNPSSDRSI